MVYIHESETETRSDEKPMCSRVSARQLLDSRLMQSYTAWICNRDANRDSGLLHTQRLRTP